MPTQVRKAIAVVSTSGETVGSGHPRRQSQVNTLSKAEPGTAIAIVAAQNTLMTAETAPGATPT